MLGERSLGDEGHLGGRGCGEVGFPGWAGEDGVGGQGESFCLHLPPPAPNMSSYLFIIKSELPLVIGGLLCMDPEG